MSEPVFLPGPDEAVPAHYGNPLAEQRALASGGAIVDVSHRSVVTVTGQDRLGWLHSLTTQHVVDLEPGQCTELLVLSPKGHIEHHVRVVDDGQCTWLLGEPGAGAGLASWLDSMKFLKQVEVADVSAHWATFVVPASMPQRGVVTWVSAWPTQQPGSCSYAAVPDQEHPGHRFAWVETLVPVGEPAFVGVSRAGTWALEALRVAAWLPRLGAETDHRTIPHELDWLRSTVHLQKGCYRGQETIARVKNLGKPPRRLVHVHLDGSEHALPEVGEPVMCGDRSVGRLTTVVQHFEDGPVALAVVKRSVPLTAQLQVAGVAVTAEPVVWLEEW